jgi:tetratricopeptide (TPR) repeat protein
MALELDGRLGAAHAELGNVRLHYEWDFPGALRSFERAVELSPSDPRALDGLARYLRLMGLGKTPKAELLLEQLLRVAPLDLRFRAVRLSNFLHTREYERGIAETERIRELEPEFVDSNVGWLYTLLGRPEDAVREMLAWLPRSGFGRAQHEAFQRGSDEGGLQGGNRAVRSLIIERGGFGLSYAIALYSATIGETEEGMIWLERAYEERDALLPFAKVDPRLDPLRSDPRFDDLLRRIGFPES